MLIPFYLIASVAFGGSYDRISKLTIFTVFISSIMIFIWIYGILIGLLYSNNPSFIIKNNAGIIGYFLVFPLLFIKYDIKIISILRISGIIILLTTLVLKILTSFAGWDVTSAASQSIFGPFVGDGGVRWGRVFTYVQYLVCVPIMYSLMSIKLKNTTYSKKLLHLTTVVLGLYTMFLVSMSKGMELAVIFSIFLTVILCIRTSKLGWKLASFSTISLGALLAIYVFLFPNNPITENFFSAEDISNVARYEQLNYILGDMKLFGNGLGATILNYTRAEGQDYGFELSYVALFHKFGILGFIPLASYVYTILMIIHLCGRNLSIRDAASLMAAMSFLMPAIGNPGLFSLQEAITHALVLVAISRYAYKSIPETTEQGANRLVRSL